jgi:hypothetical protein
VNRDSKSAKFSEKRIITIDENGQPHEKVIRQFDGDEELRPLVELGVPKGISPLFPPVPPASPDFSIPTPLAPGFDLDIRVDTIPPFGSFHFDEQRWEDFAGTFEENFRNNFEHLYSYEVDLEKMMRDFEFSFQFPDSTSLNRMNDFELSREEFQAAQQRAMEALKNIDLDHTLENVQESLKVLEDLDMQPLLKMPRDFFDHESFGKYEQALKKALIEDGYLTENEFINRMEWNDGSFKVNGKEIKEEDQNKYRALHDKYMSHGNVGNVE